MVFKSASGNLKIDDSNRILQDRYMQVQSTNVLYYLCLLRHVKLITKKKNLEEK
jgi:hypothetical protein